MNEEIDFTLCKCGHSRDVHHSDHDGFKENGEPVLDWSCDGIPVPDSKFPDQKYCGCLNYNRAEV